MKLLKVIFIKLSNDDAICVRELIRLVNFELNYSMNFKIVIKWQNRNFTDLIIKTHKKVCNYIDYFSISYSA